MKKSGPTNNVLKNLIVELKTLSIKNKVPLWKRIALELEKPARMRRQVNIARINQHIKDGETAIVPGKVLSVGDLTKKITISAYQFSETAKNKINKSGKAITIQQLLKDNPKGSKVRIIG